MESVLLLAAVFGFAAVDTPLPAELPPVVVLGESRVVETTVTAEVRHPLVHRVAAARRSVGIVVKVAVAPARVLGKVVVKVRSRDRRPLVAVGRLICPLRRRCCD